MKASQKLLRNLFLVLGAALAMAVVAVGFANAGIENAGTTSANFLSVGAGPRILGMGGATLGLGTDLAAGSWNPAAIGWMDQSTIMLSHSGLENESLQEWAAFGGRFGQTGTRWSVSGLYQGDGSFEGRDESNNATGSFSVSSFAVGAQLAQQLGPVTLGMGMKTVSENLGGVAGIGTTFDAGLMFRHGILSAGIAANNLGGHMAFENGIYPFPSNYGVGLGVSHPGTGLSLAIDANFPYAYYSDVRTGLEWRWKETIALRGGYRHEMGEGAEEDPLTGPTFGMGAGMNGFWLDYGFLLSGQTDAQHRVALTFFPGKWGGLGTDPFGQGEMPTQFETPRKKDFVGPPAPKKTRK